MKYFILDPEVAGGLGDRTEMDSSIHPPLVKKLHYELDAWLGDDIVQTFPCYLVTRSLWQRLETINPTGVRPGMAVVTPSDNFSEFNPGMTVPELIWLQIHGIPGKDDFGLTKDARLVVSERVLDQARMMHLNHCDISDFSKV